MKIVFFTDTYLPYVSGVVTVIELLSKELVKNGHKVMIVCPGEKNKTEIFDNGNFIIERISSFNLENIYPDFKGVKPRFTKNFIKVKRFDPDIIHFHTPLFLGFEAVLTAKLLKKPLIGTFHTYIMGTDGLKMFKLDNLGVLSKGISGLLWKYNNSFYKKCDLIIAPSRFSKKNLIDNGMDKKKITVLNNPTSFSDLNFLSKKEILSMKNRLKIKGKVFLYVGRISQEKNLTNLVLAFKAACEELKNVSLVFVGDGPSKNDLESLVSSLNLNKKVLFLGKIEHSELLKSGYYQLADVFVSTSCSEVQAVSFIEAMSFGLPLVLYSSRGNDEMIADNGYLAKERDLKDFGLKMIKIMKNNKERENMGKKSTEYAKRYDIKNIVLDLEECYRKIIY